MYILASQVKKLPIISLQTGQVIAQVTKPFVNDHNLEVVALGCGLGAFQRDDGVILMRDIRQVARDCILIDSFEDIEDANEIVRLKSIVERDFDPVGKSVVSESGQKLGKVEDYTINLETYMLQKLYVHQSLMKSIMFNNLVVDRTQIIDVTPKRFTVRDATERSKAFAPAAVPQK